MSNLTILADNVSILFVLHFQIYVIRSMEYQIQHFNCQTSYLTQEQGNPICQAATLNSSFMISGYYRFSQFQIAYDLNEALSLNFTIFSKYTFNERISKVPEFKFILILNDKENAINLQIFSTTVIDRTLFYQALPCAYQLLMSIVSTPELVRTLSGYASQALQLLFARAQLAILAKMTKYKTQAWDNESILISTQELKIKLLIRIFLNTVSNYTQLQNYFIYKYFTQNYNIIKIYTCSRKIFYTSKTQL
ncbi:hypothetical protein SS50377_21410 [Spironucleus salmonicida]|uniref:Uncharacterized protein n=1 Tax=Spironucleus salmonicida TaxID=348837 RepID=A0A9P8LX01_9EUKA|nr:hypothetical protein SS50377_21410 [Spironucleus salmonicida]